MASVIEFAGKNNAPETVRLVVEALVIKLFITTEEVVNRLVDVTFVNTPVEATEPPIGVLLMVPLSIVRPSATIGSVTELARRKRAPETDKLVVEALVIKLLMIAELVAKKFVVVMLVALIFVGVKLEAEKLVTLRLLKKALVDVIAVPEAVVKTKPPDKVPPANGK